MVGLWGARYREEEGSVRLLECIPRNVLVKVVISGQFCILRGDGKAKMGAMSEAEVGRVGVFCVR